MPDDGAGLDALVDVIETLQERIRRDHATIGSNEARTRKELIDPLLTALGWDDSSVVTLEYLVRYGLGKNDYRVADYALHAPGRRARPLAFIEAKRMREDLTDDHRDQAFTYAGIRDSARYVGLTNGDRWEFYEAGEDGAYRILDISIRDEPALHCAEQLRWFERGTGGFEGMGRREANVLSSPRDRGGVSAAERQSGNESTGAADRKRVLSWSALSALCGVIVGYFIGFRAADPVFEELYGGVGAAVVVVLLGLGAVRFLPRLQWRRLPWRWLWPIRGEVKNTLLGLCGGIVVGGAVGGGLGYAAGLNTAQFVSDGLAVIGIVAFVAGLILAVALIAANSRGKSRRRGGRYRSRRYRGRRR